MKSNCATSSSCVRTADNVCNVSNKDSPSVFCSIDELGKFWLSKPVPQCYSSNVNSPCYIMSDKMTQLHGIDPKWIYSKSVIAVHMEYILNSYCSYPATHHRDCNELTWAHKCLSG